MQPYMLSHVLAHERDVRRSSPLPTQRKQRPVPARYPEAVAFAIRYSDHVCWKMTFSLLSSLEPFSKKLQPQPAIFLALETGRISLRKMCMLLDGYVHVPYKLIRSISRGLDAV